MGHISPNLDFNTKYFVHNHKVYCAYCGKEIKADTEWDDYDDYNWYHCDCPDALKEIDILKKIRGIRNELDMIESELRQFQKNGKYKVVTKEVIEVIEKVE